MSKVLVVAHPSLWLSAGVWGRASQRMSICVTWVSEGYHLHKGPAQAQGLSL